MPADTTTFANRELNNYRGGPTLARPTSLYYQLVTSTPGAAAAGTAVLARCAVTNNSTTWPAAAAAAIANGVTLAFGSTAGQTLSNVVGVEEWDSLTGGFRSAYWLIPSVDISDRLTVNIIAGALVLSRT